MQKKLTLTKFTIVFFLGGSITLLSQNHQHSHDFSHHANENMTIAHHQHQAEHLGDEIPMRAKLETGQGDYIFSWDQELTAAFPEAAHEFEPRMHGGFNEDPETGIVYTGIPGYGLCAISADLKKWSVLGSDNRLKDNIHGIVFFIHKGEKYLAVAQEGKRVLVLTLDGKIVSEILKPKGTEFKFTQANEFFASEDSNFGVTDVTYLKGTLYVAHGYSKGDFVLTIKEKNGVWSWGKLAWGGKGDNPGQFQTAHGIYAHENKILVANRAAGQVVRFTKKGKFVEIFKDIPTGSLVCNVSYKDEHYFLNALEAIGNQTSAPLYVHSGDKLVSTVIPGDLDIPVLTNIHQVWPHVVNENGSKQLYLLVHGWNKGKYAVLKLEK
ncbi:hypothetical protein GH721_01720 [Kriegella sp. EG-1]|nr:hypothetical protein [Flavobacteriaceae bacterium EG-1]